ncbi:MAG: cold shock domain-containing protein [Candidatus Diapherotrites archaeon]|nr:cold shock domain-containing protein [Candidatus Diapherotrites archaeon]
MKGKVKWFNPMKGFGFIEKEDGTDIFVHVSDLPEDMRLNEGDEVEFEVAESDKGPKATKVQKLST